MQHSENKVSVRLITKESPDEVSSFCLDPGVASGLKGVEKGTGELSLLVSDQRVSFRGILRLAGLREKLELSDWKNRLDLYLFQEEFCREPERELLNFTIPHEEYIDFFSYCVKRGEKLHGKVSYSFHLSKYRQEESRREKSLTKVKNSEAIQAESSAESSVESSAESSVESLAESSAESLAESSVEPLAELSVESLTESSVESLGTIPLSASIDRTTFDPSLINSSPARISSESFFSQIFHFGARGDNDFHSLSIADKSGVKTLGAEIGTESILHPCRANQSECQTVFPGLARSQEKQSPAESEEMKIYDFDSSNHTLFVSHLNADKEIKSSDTYLIADYITEKEKVERLCKVSPDGKSVVFLSSGRPDEPVTNSSEIPRELFSFGLCSLNSQSSVGVELKFSHKGNVSKGNFCDFSSDSRIFNYLEETEKSNGEAGKMVELVQVYGQTIHRRRINPEASEVYCLEKENNLAIVENDGVQKSIVIYDNFLQPLSRLSLGVSHKVCKCSAAGDYFIVKSKTEAKSVDDRFYIYDSRTNKWQVIPPNIVELMSPVESFSAQKFLGRPILVVSSLAGRKKIIILSLLSFSLLAQENTEDLFGPLDEKRSHFFFLA